MLIIKFNILIEDSTVPAMALPLQPFFICMMLMSKPGIEITNVLINSFTISAGDPNNDSISFEKK